MSNLYAQAGADGGQAGGGSMLGMLLPFIMMFAVIWLLIIRPQQKQKKEHQKMLENLKVNDKVVTSAGIIGTIVSIKDDKNLVVLRVDEANNTKMEFQKNTIIGVVEKEKEGGNA
jgi:preprotein translocase subunit YajC